MRSDPMNEYARARAHRAWRTADQVRRVSDDMIRLGRWGLGLDGLLAWVPGVGTAYSLGAGGLLLYEAAQSGASKVTLGKMAAWLAADSLFSGVPVAGWAIDTFFRGHLMAAKLLKKDIERRHGRPPADETEPDPAGMRHINPRGG
jgi:hypothetical protein